MGNFLTSSLVVAYLAVLATPLIQPKLYASVLNEKICTDYDETLVNGKCEISMDKIPFCPGVVNGAVCVTEATSIN